MRDELKPFINQRVKVFGYLKKYGVKHEFVHTHSITFLLESIMIVSSDETVGFTKHMWLPVNETIAKKNPKCGAYLSMKCDVLEYERGFSDKWGLFDRKRKEIGLKNPSKIKVLDGGDGEDFKTFYHRSKKQFFFANKYKNFI